MSADLDVGPVVDWLGLGPIEPDGLHGRNRRKIITRHTRDSRVSGGLFLHQAVAAAYPPNRQAPLLHLLRPQPLSDALWRMVYTVTVNGGPVLLGSLIRNLALLTGPDRATAKATAETLWRRVIDHHEKSPPYRSVEDGLDEMTTVEGVTPEAVAAVMGRPPKPEGEKYVPIRISLPPDLAAQLRADPDGPSRAIARMLREAGK